MHATHSRKKNVFCANPVNKGVVERMRAMSAEAMQSKLRMANGHENDFRMDCRSKLAQRKNAQLNSEQTKMKNALTWCGMLE